MEKPIFRRLMAALCLPVALCGGIGVASSQPPVREPSQVIEAPADAGPVEEFNNLGVDVELERNRLLLQSSFHIARLYKRSSEGDWDQHSVLVIPEGSYLYRKAALAGDTAVVLAFDPSSPERILGRLYIFRENRPEWTLVQTIDLPALEFPDWVSGSLDFDGKSIAAGAGFDNTVYVYSQTRAGTFDLSATIQEDSPGSLGTTVAIEGNTLMAGAPFAQVGGTVHVYRRMEGTWHATQQLNPSDREGSDGFGSQISLKGGRVAITAENINMSEEQFSDKGAVYLFGKQDGQWSEEQKIPRSPKGSFGASVALDDRRLVISAPNIIEDGTANPFARAYAYERRNGQWSLAGELAGPPEPSNSFALDVAVYGKRIITTDPGVVTPDPLFDGQAYEYILPCEQ
jgi:hypothetical protein